MKEFFPDGSPIDEWFYDISAPDLKHMGKKYVITDYGVRQDETIYTKEIQKVIDIAAKEGGGTVVVPKGTYMTGSLYFKDGVNLYIEKDGVLKGSDDISDYNISKTRIEGETCLYFDALINVDGVKGFFMCGEGTIDGNGLKSWKAFWLRRTWNPDCTNKDEQRPRLLYVSNSQDVVILGLTLKDSHFWTSHFYRCNRVKIMNCNILSQVEPVGAPSTDAIDIDVCKDVLIKNCYMFVNDDGVALKGGKGPWADTLEENGSNERIIIEDCTYGFCHGCLTCGSESIHNKNIIVRRIKVECSGNLLWLKMRPDTPQHYEHILIEDIKGGFIYSFLNINPWTQFYDLKDRTDIPKSKADHITIRNCECECDICFYVEQNDEQYDLSEFTFENINITTKKYGNSMEFLKNTKINESNILEKQ